ncbi:MAG: glutamine--tRNA ligase/YqeY domain fusion protein [Defluviicoccus sp.]|nr:glutamine--tRNA ligase/YqeY domain fusion protein [Defluviicoccus sp.]
MSVAEAESEAPGDFIRGIVRDDIAAGRSAEIVTRFPPEPNGYLHIGHAKSIVLNFGVAREFGGRCHLRFDDTNPVKEEAVFIESIETDVRWLGYDWGAHLHFASDHFERLYEWAEHLVREGRAYVDDSSADDIRAMRGTLTEPGIESPWRGRPAAESLDLLRRMRDGEFDEGARVLRARIDMASGNVNLRDPVLYRILRAPHPRTGEDWCIYPTYDFAHGQSDAIEGVTHSLCTLEFADHRPLYDWLIDHLPVPARPRQYEFARLNLAYTVLSKRRLIRLVEEGHVAGWDDPRMPTLAGLRRRGVPPEAIRDFARRIGVARADNLVDPALLDHCIRDELNRTAERRLAVLRPLKMVIENWPEGRTDMLPAPNSPNDPDAGSREIPFGREIWVERDDFMADPPRKFHRLAPGREVRLRYAWLVTCTGVETGADGEPALLRCTYDPATRGGDAPDGRKVRGTIHWVSASHGMPAEVRLYDRLFSVPEPGAAGDFTRDLNPDSLVVLKNCMLEPSLAGAGEAPVQFERQGYFRPDPDSRPGRPVFNRVAALRDSWAKIQARGG